MNIRRGLFRFWIVLSVLFAASVIVVGYPIWKTAYDQAALDAYLQKNSILFVPKTCRDVRGQAGVDYVTSENDSFGPWEAYKNPNPSDLCWFKAASYRKLFGVPASTTDDELAQELYRDAGRPLKPQANPWHVAGMLAAIALGIPLLALALGAALYWAFRGFMPNERLVT